MSHTARIMDAAAQAAHEVNRIFCEVVGDPVSLAWNDPLLPEEIRESARQGVAGSVMGNTPEEAHRQWVKFKAAHGWTYGPVKDEVAKTHPCMVEYGMLPTAQKAKDALFLAITRATVAALNGALKA